MSIPTTCTRTWHQLPASFRYVTGRSRGAVLLETARFDDENFRTLLFCNPIAELISRSPDDVQSILNEIDSYTGSGRYVAGFVSYECGAQFQNTLADRRNTNFDVPLIRMGVFTAPIVFDHRTGRIEGAIAPPSNEAIQENREMARLDRVVLQISDRDYTEKLFRVQRYLSEGHSYQVNFTDRVVGQFTGSPISLYRGLLQGQPVSYAAFINCEDCQVLSFSPELFYRTENGRITVKPMKGTWRRGVTLEEDDRAAEMLLADEKNRAEHVTIVDLLRNDIGKVCLMGSVHVDRFMQVERYRTLHQLTSTISGALDPARPPSEIFTSLFPSGSITGAPKRRTMEIIRELERGPRGVYTGAIGWFGPRGSSCFNVAIRTLITENQRFTLGVGGGITVYSDPTEEYAECQLKASFLDSLGREFQLIETMRSNGRDVSMLDAHLGRLKKSAAYFQIPFHEQGLRNELAGRLEAESCEESRIRLALDEQSRSNIAITPLGVVPWDGRIFLSPFRTEASDVFLHHKTTRREFYQRALEEAQKDGFDEVFFMNRDGFLTEGTISNIFLLIGGALVTPDASCGLLPGIFRQYILDTVPGSQSRAISFQSLLHAENIWVCNALRGSREVRTISDDGGKVLWSRPHTASIDLQSFARRTASMT